MLHLATPRQLPIMFAVAVLAYTANLGAAAVFSDDNVSAAVGACCTGLAANAWGRYVWPRLGCPPVF
jgi:uncharacterized membrane protein YjjB (DUF3815 family)